MAQTTPKSVDTYVAIIQVRGFTKVRSDIKDTMKMLGLDKKNSMVIRESTPSMMGMVKKVKDFVTFGTVDKEIADKHGLKTTINLHPPRGGFEKGGIKAPFSKGGVLGNRGSKIADLIVRMQK